MKGIRAQRLNGPTALKLEEWEAPAPGPGQLLIDVAAAGVNLADIAAAAGERQPLPSLPFVPGLEAAGRVAALGEGVSGFKVGDKVAAYLAWGGLAEQAVADAALTVKLPKGLAPDVAAVLPAAYAGALLALKDKARLQGGETLLVLGAGGAAGLAAIAIGKILGATVIAAAGTDARGAAAGEQGADHVIDSATMRLGDVIAGWTDGKGVDVVFDPVGGDASAAALGACAPGARFLVAGFAGGKVGSLNARAVFARDLQILAANLTLAVAADPKAARAALQEVLSWAAAGKITPRIAARFAFADARTALDYVQNRRGAGAVLVTMDGLAV